MIKGIVIPVITPFEHDGTVDEPMLRKLVDFYVGAEVQGLFMLGSSGQGPAMSMAERKRTAEIAARPERRARAPDRSRGDRGCREHGGSRAARRRAGR